MNEEYRYVSNYQDNDELRDSLNALTQSEWGITVLDPDSTDYRPFSIEHHNRVVANVCVGTFDLVINGEEHSANMIQTVLTLPDYRRQGLIRELFRHVQPYISANSGLTFFQANRDKKQFYQQFGYQAHEFAEHFLVSVPKGTQSQKGLIKIDYQDEAQRILLVEATARRTAVSNIFGYQTRNWLFLWFCENFDHNNLYFIEDLNAYLIYRIEGEVLTLIDIVAQQIPRFSDLYPYLHDEGVTQVKVMFCPELMTNDYESVMNETDLFFTSANFPRPQSTFCLPGTLRG